MQERKDRHQRTALGNGRHEEKRTNQQRGQIQECFRENGVAVKLSWE